MSYSGRCVVASIFLVLIIGVGAGIAIGYFLIPDKDDRRQNNACVSVKTVRCVVGTAAFLFVCSFVLFFALPIVERSIVP